MTRAAAFAGACAGWLGSLPRRGLAFFVEPVAALPLGVFRSLLGVVALGNGFLLAPDIDAFFTSQGVLPVPAATGFRFDPLGWCGGSPVLVWGLFAVWMVAAVLTMLGLFSRVATALLFLATVAFHHRNPYILSSGDTMFRVMSFFLMLSPSGAAFSIDGVLRDRRRGEAVQPAARPMIPATAFRIMQLQVCLAYLVTGLWKAMGATWRDGSAVHLVLQLGQFRGFPLPPWAETEAFSRLATWGTLGLELLAPVLLWLPRTRLPAIAGLVCLHAALEYALTIQLFQPIMLSTLVLFLTDDELRAVLRPMTSLALILGVVPLVLGTGAGAEMRQALGTVVFSGMLGVTVCGIFSPRSSVRP